MRTLRPALIGFTLSVPALLVACADKPGKGGAEPGRSEPPVAMREASPRREAGRRPSLATPRGATPGREAPGARPAGVAAARLPEAEVKALVTAWQDAQNRGDLAAYLALYAGRFAGVKRVGLRTVRFDRKGWAADRGRMFRRKMTVGVKDLSVATHPASAIVRFQQTFTTEGFQDEGPKQLVVVREGDKLRIAREEMLASRVIEGPLLKDVASPNLTGGRFLMIAPVTAGDPLHVILEHRPLPGWAKPGYRTLLRRGLVVRDADEAKLPASLQAWKGKRLHVYAEGKRSCEVTVQGFALLAEVVPHFGTAQVWEGQIDGRKRSDAEVAKEIWNLATGNALQTQRGPGLWLVARLDRDRKGCPGGASFAQDAALPPPTLWKRVPAQGATAKALAMFRAQLRWKRIQTDYANEKGQGPWDLDSGAKPRVDVFRHPKDGRRIVVVSARAGAGCGRFESQLWEAWEVTGGTWQPLTRGQTGQNLQPSEVFEPSGSSQPAILDPHHLVTQAGKLYRVRLTYEPPFYDCGC